MFKIDVIRDFLNRDPALRNKIDFISVKCGMYCMESFMCDCQNKCKYAKLKQVRKIFPFPKVYISKASLYLSGTTTCPFHKERFYTCNDCKYIGLDPCEPELICTNSERFEMIKADKCKELNDPECHWRCKLFELKEGADNYNKKTGEKIY